MSWERSHEIFSIALIALLASLLLAGTYGCSPARGPEPAAPDTVTGLTVIAVHKARIPDSLEAVGTVRAAESTVVSSRLMGNLVEIRAQEGDRVQSGQVLAVIDDAQPRAAVDQATAAVSAAEHEVASADAELQLSESTQKRYQQLYEKKSVSPQEFDEVSARRQSAEARRDLARAGLSQAKAALVQARNVLGYTQITAPFAALVTEKKVEPGTLASPGMPLFTLEKTGRYRLEVSVDEDAVHLVRLGQPVAVSIDSLEAVGLTGKIAQILPGADAASRSFLVKIDLPADARTRAGLRSGLFGRARFARGERDAVEIPGSAVFDRGQLKGVYTVDSNRNIDLRYITLGQNVGDQVEVLSGLLDGDRIVSAPAGRELGGKQMGPAQ